jgi:PIN domain nuclease of toxin-antitoxin system
VNDKQLLVDSLVLLWILYEPKRLNNQAKTLLQNADVVCVSMVSFWELTLLHQEGRLAYTPKDLIKGADLAGLETMDIRPEHLVEMSRLKLEKGDPFDMLLIAQTKYEKRTLLTADRMLLTHGNLTVNASI